MKRQKVYWALGVLVMLTIIWFCYNVGPPLDTERPAGSLPEPEQVAASPILKAPPQGETFATGYWEGEQWHRTVPEAPETVMHQGEAMTLMELYRSAFEGSTGPTPWAERVVILNRVIAEAPYSEEVYYARLGIVMYDENGVRLPPDDCLRFERLEPLVAYHPNYPRLLSDLLDYGLDIYPELAIHYGTEALKYVDMYPIGRGLGAFPERIHDRLGFAYQVLGDYSAALAHHQKALEIVRAHPGRTRSRDYAKLVQRSIDAILSGNPHLGPLSKKGRSKAVGDVPVAAPVNVENGPAPQVVPGLESGVPLFDVFEDEADTDLSQPSKSEAVDRRELAKQHTQKMMEQAQQKAQQEQKRFENFVQQLHQMASIKTEADFESI